MVEGLAPDRDAEPAHVCKVRLRTFAWGVHLLEVHLLRRPLRCTPALDPALKRSKLTISKTTRIPALQVVEERLCLQPGPELQLLLKLVPDLRKHVLARAPVVNLPERTRQLPRLQILARRLDVHARLQRCLPQRLSLLHKR